MVQTTKAVQARMARDHANNCFEYMHDHFDVPLGPGNKPGVAMLPSIINTVNALEHRAVRAETGKIKYKAITKKFRKHFKAAVAFIKKNGFDDSILKEFDILPDELSSDAVLSSVVDGAEEDEEAGEGGEVEGEE